MITPKQIRAARSLLGWTQTNLAGKCGLSTVGINRLEREVSDPGSSTLRIIQATFEGEGIVFINDEDFEGVKQKKASRDHNPHWLKAYCSLCCSLTPCPFVMGHKTKKPPPLK
jgi:transcriptional regulator with XRE-family HTH domain